MHGYQAPVPDPRVMLSGPRAQSIMAGRRPKGGDGPGSGQFSELRGAIETTCRVAYILLCLCAENIPDKR